jgi:hypothetical protein
MPTSYKPPSFQWRRSSEKQESAYKVQIFSSETSKRLLARTTSRKEFRQSFKGKHLISWREHYKETTRKATCMNWWRRDWMISTSDQTRATPPFTPETKRKLCLRKERKKCRKHYRDNRQLLKNSTSLTKRNDYIRLCTPHSASLPGL